MNCLNRNRFRMHILKRSKSSFAVTHARFCGLFGILLSGVIFLSSCAFPWAAKDSTPGANTSRIATNKNTLDSQSLVRELANCISDSSQIEYVYHTIPASQLDGMSYATFDAYILALSRLHTGTVGITSFSFLAKKEKKTILDAILVNASAYKDLISVTTPVELFYANRLAGDPSVYIYIQTDTNGTAYLSSTWVKECLNLYDFAGLYFNSLEKQNSDAVASLIMTSQVPEQGAFSADVVRYKAIDLTQYYHLKVQSQFSEYLLRSLDISQLSYMQPEVLDDISLNYQTRTVGFVRNSLGAITVNDSVNIPLLSKELTLYNRGVRIIRIGDQASSKQFLEFFGAPLQTAIGDPSASGSVLSDTQKYIVLSYATTSVTVLGTLYDDGTWNGQIVRIRLRAADSNFSLGTTVHIGMTRDELLMMYPFADQTNYVLTTTLDDQKYEMTFAFADDAKRTVTGVKLEMIR